MTEIREGVHTKFFLNADLALFFSLKMSSS